MPWYRVYCAVSGGVTGFRESYLRDESGELRFPTYDQAEAVASHLRATMGRNSPATFYYSAEEIGNAY